MIVVSVNVKTAVLWDADVNSEFFTKRGGEGVDDL